MKIKLNFDTVSYVIGICTSLLIFISQGPYENTWNYLLPFTPLGFVFIILTIKQIIIYIFNSRTRYLLEELNFIKSTKVIANWILRAENENGDLHVKKCHFLKLYTNSRIKKTTEELIYSTNELTGLPPEPVVTNTNNHFKLKTHDLRTGKEKIDGVETKKYKWRFEIEPPLSKKGDYVEYTFEYNMPNEVKKAFSEDGDLIVLEQRKFFQETNLSLISPKSYKIQIIDTYIEEFDGARVEIKSNENIPQLSINDTVLDWKTKYRHFSRYICKYKFIKE